MNRRMFLLLAGPGILLGLALTGTCLAAVWSLNRLQANLASILSDNVTGVRAAHRLQIELRHLRFHSLLYAMDPVPARAERVTEDRVRFEAAFEQARQSAPMPEESRLLDAIAAAYEDYPTERDRGEFPSPGATTAELLRWADAHPVRQLTDRCQELAAINEQAMQETASESEAVGSRARVTLWALGVAGPLGGLVAGFGIARGLNRTIARLNVRLEDLHAGLDREVGSLRLSPRGDLAEFDQQLGRVVERVRGVVAQLQEQERAAVRAEQLAAVGQLAAGLAHNIRNPLTAVKLLVSGALHGGASRQLTSADLEVIHREVARLEQMVEGLLDLARPASARPEPGDLREAVRHAVDLVRARADAQGVPVRLSVPDTAVPATWDRGPFGMALVNLLWNALDAMPAGGNLTVTLEAIAGGAEIRVRDAGPGIHPEMSGRLFTPFSSTKPSGTGLGLATCRRVVEQHGGSIDARNAPDGGAIFTIHLPASEGPPDADVAGR